jgi:hypothetical protein
VNIRTTPEITIRDYVKGQTLTVENPDKPKIQLLIDKGEYFACVEDDVDKVQSDINLMDTWTKDASERMKIKIDQRFVRDIDTSVENQAIVRAVISLARDLGMRVAAEGVENEQQATILAGLGCTEVQGFLYSRPIPSFEIEKVEAEARRSSNILKLRRKA